jgi:hypothetical protein
MRGMALFTNQWRTVAEIIGVVWIVASPIEIG